MPYKDVNDRILSPAKNPYAASGSASSVVGQYYGFSIIQTKFVTELLSDVKHCIQFRRAIRLFFVGDYGYGKTTQLNLVGKEVVDAGGITIPIKFQEIVCFIKSSDEPGEDLIKLHGAILHKISRLLISQGFLTKEECRILDSLEYMDLFDGICELLNKTQKSNILLVFDEIEILFDKLTVSVQDFMGFMHNLSEKLASRPSWGICISITEEYYSQIYQEARQLQEGRFDFKILKALTNVEVREYILQKNSGVTLRPTETYPFEDDVVDFVAVVSGGIPRFIETICELLWFQSEQSNSSVTLENARRILSNKYQVYAEAYFSELCGRFTLSSEVEAFMKLLFYSGKSCMTITDLVSIREATLVSSFQGLSDRQARYRLNKAGVEVRSKPIFLGQFVEVNGNKPYKYKLTSTIYKNIFNFRSQL